MASETIVKRVRTTYIYGSPDEQKPRGHDSSLESRVGKLKGAIRQQDPSSDISNLVERLKRKGHDNLDDPFILSSDSEEITPKADRREAHEGLSGTAADLKNVFLQFHSSDSEAGHSSSDPMEKTVLLSDETVVKARKSCIVPPLDLSKAARVREKEQTAQD